MNLELVRWVLQCMFFIGIVFMIMKLLTFCSGDVEIQVYVLGLRAYVKIAGS